MPARPRASLIYNPNAGRRRHARTIDGIKAALEPVYELAITPTRAPKEAIGLAREAAARADAVVFAWGGDGTIREVVEGILGSPVILGVLPGGTFNVVPRAVGLPPDPVRAAQRLASARPAPRDVGLIGETPFLMQVTAGLDAFIMHNVRPGMKARFGMAGAFIDAFRVFSRYSFPRFEVEVDGDVQEVTGAAFVNMTDYAGPFHIVPGGRWDDRVGHALLYRGRTHRQAIFYAIDIALGRHHLRPEVTIREAASMTIRKSPGLCLQTDGDPWSGALPATCRLAADRIQVLIPDRQ